MGMLDKGYSLQMPGRNPTVLTRAIPRLEEEVRVFAASEKSQSHRTDQGDSEEKGARR
jgi:hypothetical protein